MRSPHKLSFPLYAYIFIQYAPIVFVLIIRIFLDFTTFQKHNCVKGQHDYKDAMQLVVNLGGQCGDNVTAKTNYLILGNNDFCSLIKDGKSNKQKKAESLILKGKDIQILSENVFYDLVLNQ